MPSVMSMTCNDARSSWEYDFTAATSSDTRPVDSLTSWRRAVSDSVPAVHSSAGPRCARSSSSATRWHHATSTPAAARGGAMRQLSSTPWASSQTRRASSRSATAIGSTGPVGGSISLRIDSMAMNCSADSDRSASSTSDASSPLQVASIASTARTVAAAGLLSSCARPAASPPSATSASRWRDIASMFRTVWKKPSIMWMPKGNHVRTSSPSDAAGTRSIRPGTRRPTRGQVAGRVGPGPEAAGPDTGTVHRRDDRLLSSGAPEQLHPTFEQDPPEVGRVALHEQHLAVVEGELVAVGDQLPDLLVAQAGEEEDPPELADLHQIVAR